LVGDLTVDGELAEDTIQFTMKTFTSTDCAVFDECIQPGPRRLLRFATATPNIGNGDIQIGTPNVDPGFVVSMCHGHSHYLAFMSYRLLSSDGSTVVAMGFKPSFCLEDVYPLPTNVTPGGQRYTCANNGAQGIQAG
jgi:hypothetical protein